MIIDARSSNTKSKMGRKFIQNVEARHKDKIRAGQQNITAARKAAMTPAVVNEHFDMVRTVRYRAWYYGSTSLSHGPEGT